MSNQQLQFLITDDIGFDDFASQLVKTLSFETEPARTLTRIWYDSFDWRLYKQGEELELVTNSRSTVMTRRSLNGSRGSSSQRIQEIPRFSQDLPDGPLRRDLGPVLEMRALLPRLRIRSKVQTLVLRNKDEKIVLRLALEENRAFHHQGKKPHKLGKRIRIEPVRGYPKAAERVARILREEMKLVPAQDNLMLDGLAAIGRKAGDYSHKLNLKFDADMRSDEAARIVFRDLLAAMEINEPGTRQDLDSEFLHDFRVAIRRTRSALTQIKGVLPQKTVERFKAGFAWLGQITSPTRDMDVYLLKFDDYHDSLPESVQDDLQPLHEFLRKHQKLEHASMVKALDSARYRNLIQAWRKVLEAPIPETSRLPNAMRPISELASERIWRMYRRAIKEGKAIDDDSPADDVHELRKTCKKLRYLMEFFQSLYPADQIRKLIKVLKLMQDILGDFQDYEVQVDKLKEFSRQMMDEKMANPETLLAMGILIDSLEKRQHQCRQNVTARFSAFSTPKHQKQFRELFAPVSQQAKG